jgi:hypothetical protein
MIDRDDWLSPAAFVAGIDLKSGPQIEMVITRHTPENRRYVTIEADGTGTLPKGARECVALPEMVSIETIAKIYRGELRPCPPYWVDGKAPIPAPVICYDPTRDELIPVTQEWVDAANKRMKAQHAEIERLKAELDERVIRPVRDDINGYKWPASADVSFAKIHPGAEFQKARGDLCSKNAIIARLASRDPS